MGDDLDDLLAELDEAMAPAPAKETTSSAKPSLGNFASSSSYSSSAATYGE
jgi:hypothetical protein